MLECGGCVLVLFWGMGMTKEQVRAVLVFYRAKLSKMKVPRRSLSHSALLGPDSATEALAHCHQMLDEMEVFLAEGQMEKLFRWLGFVQGCFWVAGLFTIDDMRKHNRS